METLSDWEGRLIGGRYELREHIFTSDMSSVFKAWDYQGKCDVAIKIVANNPSDDFLDDSLGDTLANRLRHEKNVLKKLKHPHVVRLLDWGREPGLRFVVVEYLHGSDLGERIDNFGPVEPEDECVRIVIQLLEAVGAMEKAGFIHRDIKPENIMLADDGTIKLIDFGLTKSVSNFGRRRKRITLDGHIVGTRGYLSPEQSENKPLDFSSDLYNCGLILFELLTGKLPFSKRAEKVNAEDMERQMRYLFKISRASVKIQAVIRKALQSDPKLRYQTAEEMRLALLDVVKPFSFKLFFGGLLAKAWKCFSR